MAERTPAEEVTPLTAAEARLRVHQWLTQEMDFAWGAEPRKYLHRRREVHVSARTADIAASGAASGAHALNEFYGRIREAVETAPPRRPPLRER